VLTNLAHLDSLRVRVTPPPQPGHTTFRLAEEPSVEVVWTYAERLPDGSYLPVGGGPVDPDTGHYTQGAFNADDIARAAVVYLRHWRATGADTSRDAARQLLRGLCYLQTVHDDPDDLAHGNVVLWQQPDGTLNRSGIPAESPDPSDSGESAWLARTVWALGEGYAAFQGDPDFGAFLRRRLRLAMSAIRRQVLPRYGQWRVVEDSATPAWLIGDGADLTGEALLGLCAYTGCTGDDDARKLLEQLAEGVTAMRTGTPWTWPFGAVLPSALSRSAWHGWAGLAPAGLARVYEVAGDLAARDAALADAASFTPHLLVEGGPDNLRVAVPGSREALTIDGVQLSYGAQSRVESLLTTARVTGRSALSTLAGIAGSWFFGNNPAGAPMYDPATGRTYDGVDIPDAPPQQTGRRGVVHRDAGAESTIHGLLAMLALDADPHAAAVARIAEPDLQADDGDCRKDGELRCLTLRDPLTGARLTLLRSVATSTRVCDVDLAGSTESTATVTVNDPGGEELEHYTTSAGRIRALVPAGGFTVITRMPETV
jgi:hypothetical protein